MKCSLKPIRESDYEVSFSPAEMTRLRSVFPQGVCNWSKDGNHTGVVPNGSFGPSRVDFVGVKQMLH